MGNPGRKRTKSDGEVGLAPRSANGTFRGGNVSGIGGNDGEMPWDADSIVAQLSIKDKLSLITGKSMWSTTDKLKRRFGLPPIMLCDGPHGLRKTISETTVLESLPATCFPTATALACCWNPDLLKQVGSVIAKECRHNNVSVILGPGMNLQRHPCGGRTFEYFSEDPLLTGKLAAALVMGVQSYGVGACIKHVCVNNQESMRFVLDVNVDDRSLRELYLRGFEIAIRESQPALLMTAYNKLNGEFCSEHKWLYQDVIRGEWGFEGAIVTDWGATNSRVKGIIAGVDLEMPGSCGAHDEEITEALKSGELSQSELDAVVKRNVNLILKSKSQLNNPDFSNGVTNDSASDGNGADTPMQESDYVNVRPRLPSDFTTPLLTDSGIDLESHNAVAHRVALECAVLLKNDGGFLPLAREKKVAVIGSFAKKPRYQGMGSSQVNAFKLETLWDHLAKYTKNATYTLGFDGTHTVDDEQVDSDLIAKAVDAAKAADVVILMTGLPEISESEAFDRTSLSLPAHSNVLIQDVCDTNPNTVVVLSNGGPVTMPWISKPKAVVEAFLLGQAGGRALVDCLYGSVSFSGKLAMTFANQLNDIPADQFFPGDKDLSTVEYREGLNVGYRYFASPAAPPVLFPFGHGLSYATFAYEQLVATVQADDSKQKKVTIQFRLTNTSSVPAAEIAQCYVHSFDATVYRPEIELKGFDKIYLQAGESKTVTMQLSEDSFSFYDTGAQRWVVEAGKYNIKVGASSQDIRLATMIELKIGEAASEEARSSHPPKDLSYPLVVDDDEFSDMMGLESAHHLSTRVMRRTIQPSHKAIIHRNSLLEDVRHTWVGSLFAHLTFQAMKQELADPKDPKQQEIAKAIRNNLPLRGLVLFSSGRMSFGLLDFLIHLMNGSYTNALRGMFSNRRTDA